ncbi:MAG TPA: FGGY family carbohydrate kinase [Pseudothermotoga sp.]|nr:FGGY family carbohydrate kinase [Pseudothermotoga sp.]HOK83756.1 FGGY family carbohydrate kinase [Pseudothermotoga sp.]HPP70342.1 FGGY family carbohydrate kinase [Pseudothermotoga sp.]
MSIVLSIDCGTQSLKALAFDENGNLIDMCKVEYPQPYVSPKPGWAEQDLSVYELPSRRSAGPCSREVKSKPKTFLPSA